MGLHEDSSFAAMNLVFCINCNCNEAWTTIAATTQDKREKIHALSLAKECYSMKIDLLTNATVVGDAML